MDNNVTKSEAKFFRPRYEKALSARENAQHIAFAPIVFQATRVLRDSGILEAIAYSGQLGLSLEEIVKNIIPKCELEITGLVFYPFKSGISYIYTDKAVSDKNTYNNNNIKIVSNESYNMIHEIKNFLTSRVYSYENNGIKKILFIEPTEISDVFNLYENNNLVEKSKFLIQKEGKVSSNLKEQRNK